MENKIYFLGNSKDLQLAERLYSLVADELVVKKDVLVLAQGSVAHSDGNFDAAAVELGMENKVEAAHKIYTYSAGQSNADICGFNFQKREMSRSLELLSGSVMGRVNIPVNSEYTEVSVLYCAAGLLAAEVSMTEILKAINQKIS